MASSEMERKTGDCRIYIVSIMLFSCIVVGGAFLAMYIHHPESQSNSWYPTAGMILVGIPWIFWILTFIYAWLKKIVLESLPRKPTTNNNNNNNKIAPENVNARTSGATSTTSNNDVSPGGGGGGGGPGHVRFGAAKVMGEEDDKADDVVDSDAHSDIDQESRDNGGARHIGGGGGATRSSPNNNGDGSNSSLGSHESELPLTYSMS